MRTLLALLFFPPFLWSQTTIPPSQLRFGAPGELDKLRLFAVGLSGMVQVSLGPGLRLEEVPGAGIRLALTAPPVPHRLRSAVIPRSADGTYASPRDRVFTRNGIIVSPGVDFDHDGTKLTPRTAWATDDVVVALSLDDGSP